MNRDEKEVEVEKDTQRDNVREIERERRGRGEENLSSNTWRMRRMV